MKYAAFTLVLSISFYLHTQAQKSDLNSRPEESTANNPVEPLNRRLNFYVVNKPHTLDLFSRLVIWRARKRGMSRREKFVVVVVRSSAEAREKIVGHLKRKNALIGSLWFDSHGVYANGYSSFSLGHEQFSYKTIRDTGFTKHLAALAPYCDQDTKVAIGSCYSGATYEKPEHEGRPASRMNGDSLMIGLANILPSATIYGTGGWVMTKPGVFRERSYALAGFPIQRRFKDEVYRPVWHEMGVWHRYNAIDHKFEKVNTISLTPMGTIHIKGYNYLDKQKYKKRLARNLSKLRSGLLKT
jgi:hypothetical protein